MKGASVSAFSRSACSLGSFLGRTSVSTVSGRLGDGASCAGAKLGKPKATSGSVRAKSVTRDHVMSLSTTPFQGRLLKEDRASIQTANAPGPRLTYRPAVACPVPDLDTLARSAGPRRLGRLASPKTPRSPGGAKLMGSGFGSAARAAWPSRRARRPSSA